MSMCVSNLSLTHGLSQCPIVSFIIVNKYYSLIYLEKESSASSIKFPFSLSRFTLFHLEGVHMLDF